MSGGCGKLVRMGRSFPWGGGTNEGGSVYARPGVPGFP
jgi:hypothetical protein